MVDPMHIQRTTLLATGRFNVERVQYETADGTPRQKEVIRHPGAVAILPLLEDGRVCLIRNMRVAVERTLIELPAGTLEPGEDPAVTAARELLEETGYRARRWTELPCFYMSPGILDERMHLFVAEELEADQPRREPGEQIENLIVTWKEALAMALRGDIRDAKTLVGLLLYDRLQHQPRQEQLLQR